MTLDEMISAASYLAEKLFEKRQEIQPFFFGFNEVDKSPDCIIPMPTDNDLRLVREVFERHRVTKFIFVAEMYSLDSNEEVMVILAADLAWHVLAERAIQKTTGGAKRLGQLTRNDNLAGAPQIAPMLSMLGPPVEKILH